MTARIFLLLLFVIPLSLLLWVLNIGLNAASGNKELAQNPTSPLRWLFAILIPICIVHHGIKKNSLSKSGAIAALFIGFFITLSNYCFFAALLMFFLAGSKVTKFRAQKKKQIEEGYKEGGMRNWVQVVCNGGIAAELSVLYMCDTGCREVPVDFSTQYTASWLSMAVLGALSAASGDTFSSEIGTVVGLGEPWLVTTLSKVPTGTNGGISVVGTLSSGLGGLLVGIAYYCTSLLFLSAEQLQSSPPQWPVLVVATLAGLLGSFIDSVLGAVFQYSGYDPEKKQVVAHPGEGVEDISGMNILDNNGVNLLTLFLTAVVTPSIAFSIWGHV